MGLIGDLVSTVENKLLSVLQPVLGPINALVNLVGHFKQTITDFVTAGQDIYDLVVQIEQDIKGFSARPDIKNRVISISHVTKNANELLKIPNDIVTKVKDLIQILKKQLGTESVPEPADLEADVEGLSDLKTLAQRFGPRVSAIFEKVLGFLAVILGAFSAASSALNDIKGLLNDLKTLIEDADRLDILFLQQKNKRRTVDTSARQRIGKLHG